MPLVTQIIQCEILSKNLNTDFIRAIEKVMMKSGKCLKGSSYLKKNGNTGRKLKNEG